MREMKLSFAFDRLGLSRARGHGRGRSRLCCRARDAPRRSLGISAAGACGLSYTERCGLTEVIPTTARCLPTPGGEKSGAAASLLSSQVALKLRLWHATSVPPALARPNPAFNTDVLQPASPASARGLTPKR